jgi:poly-gamma-glutamate capsule biosynthesis protein CapA/YwtB (metallophosphatase superfamily)
MNRRTALRLLALLLLAAVTTIQWSEDIVITAVGDIMPAGQAAGTLSVLGFDYPFSATTAVLKKGDIVVGNLEVPLTRGGKEFSGKKFRFRAGPEAATALNRAGFTLLTLANNHIMDFGTQGLMETLATLDQARILHTGAGSTLDDARREAIVTVKGDRVAFLAYSLTYPAEFYAGAGRPGTAQGLTGRVAEDITRARRNARYVVVSFHWGGELLRMPKPYQQKAAHAAIDAGADLVLGHHPHVLQGIERYRGKCILYSLGNFVFGSMSRSADRSMIARITLNGRRQTMEVIPLNVLNSEVRFRPMVLTGKQGDEVIQRLNQLSAPFGSRIIAREGRYLQENMPMAEKHIPAKRHKGTKKRP